MSSLIPVRGRRSAAIGIVAGLAAGATLVQAGQPPRPASQRIDLVDELKAGKLRTVNRDATPLAGGRDAVHVTERAGPGVAWIEGSEFGDGTIEVDVRGRDVLQRSFVGIAFHRADDDTYEAVYLRPFNFRSQDAERHRHAVQYIAVPEYDWPRLRREFPEKYEAAVDASASPADWVALRVVVKGPAIQVYVAGASTPALEVQELVHRHGGAVGLWTGNNSDGDFADLRLTAAR